MSTKKRLETATEREGVNYLRALVERANCIFHEIHRENDFGNDAIIEFVENESVKGVCVAVQIKSGNSYCTKATCSVPADRAHFEYWSNHSLPVIGVVYDPSEGVAYWTNITAYLSQNREAVNRGPYAITFLKDDLSRLTDDSFVSVFTPIFLKRAIVFDFAKSVEWAMADDYAKHSIGLTSLLYGHRQSPQTWDVFISILRTRDRASTNPMLIYYLALIPGHQDIFWTSNNQVSDEIKKYVDGKLAELQRPDVVKLLTFIDENGVGRGTIGQNVIAITELIDGRRQILEDIALDATLDFTVRTMAIPVFIGYESDGVATFLSKLLGVDEPMRKHAQWIIRNLQASEGLGIG